MFDRRLFLRKAIHLAGFSNLLAQSPDPCKLPPNKLTPLSSARNFKPDRQTVRPRPLISEMTPVESGHLRDNLKKAYLELKSRPDSDHWSLTYQGWIHDLYCGGNRDVHGTWLFLPWHRAYLYFHERRLQLILGRDFRLPVWDWDRHDSVPSFYTEWSAQCGCPHVHDDLRGFIKSCSLQAWLLSNKPADFVGAGDDSGNAQRGPHSFIHTYIKGLLTNPRTAAADPLFYAHHANVDRFWSYWARAYVFQNDPNWLKQTFVLLDETGEPVNVCVRDLLDEKALGYQYDTWPNVELFPFLNVMGVIDNASETVSFSVAALTQLLHLLQNIVSDPLSFLSDALNAAMHLNMSGFPLRVSANMPEIKPGEYYFIGMQPTGTSHPPDARVLGGFGQFSPHHLANVVVMGCISLDDLQFLLQHNGHVRFVYGPPDPSMTTIVGPKPLLTITETKILYRA